MDILIELIVWLFKALFGEQERTADLPPTQRPTPRKQQQRGPYTYGDEGAPKTLEEILEEARRKAQQRGGGGAGPTPSNPVRPPAAKVSRRVVADAPVAPSGPPVVRPLVGAPLATLAETEPVRPSDSIDWATKRQTPEPPRPEKPKKKKAETAPKTTRMMEESPSQSTLPAAREAIVERPRVATVRTIAAPVKTTNAATMEFINAIRTATPAQKAAVARQAIIMFEIFGPPRAMRRHRTPGILSASDGHR